MSKGLHRNQEAYQKGHGDLGQGVKRAGVKNVKVAAGPAGGNPMPTPTPLPWNRTAKGERKYMNKGGSVKKRKGYKHGGMVDTPGVSVMPNQPVTVPRLTKTGLREIGQPVGYKHGGMVKRAGLK